MADKKSISMLTSNQIKTYTHNAQLIKYYRENPVVACEDLLGVRLLDYQAFLISKQWTSKFGVWLISRNGAKSITASIYIMLLHLLFEDMRVYIVSSSGGQAKDTFSNIERLATNAVPTMRDLPDIFSGEIKRSNDSLTGFSHSPASFEYTMINGGYAKTLNGIPDNYRGKRADLCLFDEMGWITPEQATIAEAFATGSRSFATSGTDKHFSSLMEKEKRPTQLLYTSSASDKNSYFYSKYEEYAKRQFAGDSRYFCVDLNVELPLNPTQKGLPHPALLDRAVVDDMMSSEPNRCMREYYNVFESDGGDEQIIKSHTILKNSTFLLPEITPEQGAKYILVLDPASISDNSILGIGKICRDEQKGIYGKMVNMVNFKDTKDTKGNRQMLQQEQVEEMREYLVRYNGDNLEYQNIHKVAVDGGMGGAGILYGQHFLMNFKTKDGTEHRGITDNEFFKDQNVDYPNAFPILRIVEPTVWKPIMVQRLVDLLSTGHIEMPKEYKNSGYVDMEDDNGELIRRYLSKEEELALANLDIMKEEAKNIHQFKSSTGRVSYDTRVDMRRKVRDDRFYCLCLFANEIFELREAEVRNNTKYKKEKTKLPSLYGKGTANSSH